MSNKAYSRAGTCPHTELDVHKVDDSDTQGWARESALNRSTPAGMPFSLTTLSRRLERHKSWKARQEMGTGTPVLTRKQAQ